MPEKLLSLDKINKSFSGVSVLQNICWDVHKGKVHALLGENGAGKSTLIKIISGVYSLTSGKVSLEGEAIHFSSPQDAVKAGINVIYQETSLVPTLTVLENVFLGIEPIQKGLIDEKDMELRYSSLVEKVGVDIDRNQKVSGLGVAEKKIVEIMKALARESRLIIMDEPTDSLSAREVDLLFNVIKDLKSKGITLIYITHFLDEVFRISDRITILKDGMLVCDRSAEEMTVESIVSHMVGDILELEGTVELSPEAYTTPRLEVRNLRADDTVNPSSFKLYPGEVLGITGVVGAGKSELGHALFGAVRRAGGEILLNGSPCRIRSPRDAVSAGIGMTTEDRKETGLLLDDSIRCNLSLASLKRILKNGIIHSGNELALSERSCRSLEVKSTGPEQHLRFLSGGNQQKIVIGKWLAADPDVLIMDEPTRGIDIGAKQAVYKVIRELASKGKSVIFLSSELPEVHALCHRILVMGRGYIQKEFHPEDSIETIMKAMLEGDA